MINMSETHVFTSFHPMAPFANETVTHSDYLERSRDRIIMACVHCRKRKSKCDGTTPSCKPCERAGRSCRYEPVSETESWMAKMRKKRDRQRKAAVAQEREEARSRQLLFESMLRTEHMSPSTCPCCPPPVLTSPTFPSIYQATSAASASNNVGLGLLLGDKNSPQLQQPNLAYQAAAASPYRSLQEPHTAFPVLSNLQASLASPPESCFSTATTPNDLDLDCSSFGRPYLQTPLGELTPLSTPDLVSSSVISPWQATPCIDYGDETPANNGMADATNASRNSLAAALVFPAV